jgi:hypothetical protein
MPSGFAETRASLGPVKRTTASHDCEPVERRRRETLVLSGEQSASFVGAA